MSDVHEIELSIEHANELIERKAMVNKLMSNREFKKIVLEGYFKEEAIRMVALVAEPSMKDHKEDILKSMESISCFQQHLRTIVQMGTVAETEMLDYEQTLDEARNDETLVA